MTDKKSNIGKVVLGVAAASFVGGVIIGGLMGYDMRNNSVASDEDMQRNGRLRIYSDYNRLLESLPNYYSGGGYEGFDTEWAIADLDSFYKLGKEYSELKKQQKK